MDDEDRAANGVSRRECPEEAARAIASALEFLRAEATAIGLHNVGALIELALARMYDQSPSAVRTLDDH